MARAEALLLSNHCAGTTLQISAAQSRAPGRQRYSPERQSMHSAKKLPLRERHGSTHHGWHDAGSAIKFESAH